MQSLRDDLRGPADRREEPGAATHTVPSTGPKHHVRCVASSRERECCAIIA